MDTLYNKKKLLRCIKYLHRHPDAWKELHVACDTYSGSLLAVEEVPERHDAWVEYYYRMDDDFQDRFSEYWLPIGENFPSDWVFVDLLFPALPIIVYEKRCNICICPSLIQFVEEHRSRNHFYHKWFRPNVTF